MVKGDRHGSLGSLTCTNPAPEPNALTISIYSITVWEKLLGIRDFVDVSAKLT